MNEFGKRRVATTLLGVLAAASVGCVSLKDGDVPAPLADSGPGVSGLDGDTGVAQPDATIEAAEGDGAPDSSATPSDAATDAPTSPLSVAADHLGLWLTARQGVECSSGRVSTWHDQGPHHRDAAPKLGQLPPHCNVPGGAHAFSGIELPFFSAPNVADSGPNVIDETLDVDLSFLVGHEYTFFTVERRWADDATKDEELIFGTTIPPAQEQAILPCAAGPANVALFFGYTYYQPGAVLITLDQLCTELVGTDQFLASPPPAPLSEHTGRFDLSQGHAVWANGVPFAVNSDRSPLTSAVAGAIGRALYQTTIHNSDPRYRGDIAEVIVYDAALGDADRTAIEAYLRAQWKLPRGP
jgi:hypothetical protein